MNDRFDQIDMSNEKVKKIVNSAFEIFSKNNYEKASTYMIMEKAGITKGLLYHYFKNKQELFDFLLYFSLKESILDIEKKMDWDEKDFLKRLRQLTELKIKSTNRYPYLSEFYTKYSLKIKEWEVNHIKDNEMLNDFLIKFYKHNLDYSLIKDDVNIEQMIKVINYTIKGIWKDYFNKSILDDGQFDIQGIIEEVDVYINFFRDHFYK